MIQFTPPLSDSEREEFSAELSRLVKDCWFYDRDPNPSDKAAGRARAASHELAGFVMHNLDAMLSMIPPDKAKIMHAINAVQPRDGQWTTDAIAKAVLTIWGKS